MQLRFRLIGKGFYLVQFIANYLEEMFKERKYFDQISSYSARPLLLIASGRKYVPNGVIWRGLIRFAKRKEKGMAKNNGGDREMDAHHSRFGALD